MNIRYFILSLTNRCNLNCVYCYNGGQRECMDMSESVLNKAMELAERGDGPFHLQLTGGEPTLAPGLIEAAVRGARALERPCSIGLQTNATLLTPSLAEMLKFRGVQTGVSLDGPPSIQNILRGKAGATLRGLRLLDDYEIPFRVTTVVSGNNAPFLEHLVYVLAGFAHARGIGLDLLVEKGRAKGSEIVFPADARALRKGAKAMVRALRAVNAKRRIPLELRELSLLRRRKEQNGDVPFCMACLGQSVAVHPDGRLFPCGQSLGDPLFEAGTVWRPNLENLNISTFSPFVSEKCGECPLRNFCPGECPSRMHYNRGRSPRLACELYRALWDSESHATSFVRSLK